MDGSIIFTPEREANPYNYASLKAIAKMLRQQGHSVQVTDLLVLASKNDPFYEGSPSQLRDAGWFADIYQKLGARPNMHLRRIHYQILELSEADRKLPVTLTTTIRQGEQRRKISLTHYENYQRCWDWLTEAAKHARYLGLLPLDALTDQRAKESSFTFNAHWPKPGDWNYEDPRPRYEVTGEWERWRYELPELPALEELLDLADLPGFEVQGYRGMQQPYHLEIWVEKAEGEDVFLPLCRKYGLNFVPGVGDMSITTTWRFCQRARESERPAKLLYISDFDPSGFNMPVAVARKLEYFVRNHGFDDLDITLEPVMLTAEQVRAFQLPPLPIKDSDQRKDQWEQAYGGAVELNAMFANDERIRAAREIVEGAILRYYDTTLLERAQQQREALVQALATKRAEILAQHGVAWEQLQADYATLQDAWERTRAEFARLIRPFQEQIDGYQAQVAGIQRQGEELYGLVSDDLAIQVDIEAAEEYPLPEPLYVEPEGVLYHSQRGYWQQLLAYRQHKANGEAEGDPDWLYALIAAEMERD